MEAASRAFTNLTFEGVTACPRCGKLVDSLVMNRGVVCCSFCQKLQIPDIFAIMAKMPNYRKRMFVAVYDDSAKENSQLSLNNLRIHPADLSVDPKEDPEGHYGYLEMRVNSEILGEDPKEFSDKYQVVCMAVERSAQRIENHFLAPLLKDL